MKSAGECSSSVAQVPAPLSPTNENTASDFHTITSILRKMEAVDRRVQHTDATLEQGS